MTSWPRPIDRSYALWCSGGTIADTTTDPSQKARVEAASLHPPSLEGPAMQL
jgi:hypothetical protein